ncbi:hypothetical protein KY366_04115 [Candidatus Woesearchaeota archaeon]|nr:hypothetical protein [Candidatus Woesearchaeota archaeon]
MSLKDIIKEAGKKIKETYKNLALEEIEGLVTAREIWAEETYSRFPFFSKGNKSSFMSYCRYIIDVRDKNGRFRVGSPVMENLGKVNQSKSQIYDEKDRLPYENAPFEIGDHVRVCVYGSSGIIDPRYRRRISTRAQRGW